MPYHCEKWLKVEGRYCDEDATIHHQGLHRCARHDPLLIPDDCRSCNHMGVRVYPGTPIGQVETCRECGGTGERVRQ